MVVALTEIMPAKVRATGFSLAYSLATAFLGGFTPFVCTYLIESARHFLPADKVWLANSMPGIWLTAISMLSLCAIWLLYRRHDYLHDVHRREFEPVKTAVPLMDNGPLQDAAPLLTSLTKS